MVKWIREHTLPILVTSILALLAAVLVTTGQTSGVYLLENPTDEQIARIYEELPASTLSLHNVKGNNMLIEMNTDVTWWKADNVDEWLNENGIDFIKVD